jgi:hypothetical protein
MLSLSRSNCLSFPAALCEAAHRQLLVLRVGVVDHRHVAHVNRLRQIRPAAPPPPPLSANCLSADDRASPCQPLRPLLDWVHQGSDAASQLAAAPPLSSATRCGVREREGLGGEGEGTHRFTPTMGWVTDVACVCVCVRLGITVMAWPEAMYTGKPARGGAPTERVSMHRVMLCTQPARTGDIRHCQQGSLIGRAPFMRVYSPGSACELASGRSTSLVEFLCTRPPPPSIVW